MHETGDEKRVDKGGPERAIILTASRSLLGQVGRKETMEPRNDKNR